jgi:hypothetical protein
MARKAKVGALPIHSLKDEKSELLLTIAIGKNRTARLQESHLIKWSKPSSLKGAFMPKQKWITD